MELSSLFQELRLHLHPPPSQTLPPITELLSKLQEKLLSRSPSSERLRLIGRVETLFQTADPDWLFFSRSGGWAELRATYGAVVAALVAAAALPPCEDDCSSLPAAAYQGVPRQAGAVCSALTALLGAVGDRGAETGLPLTVAPPVLVFAVTHVQDQPWTDSASRAAARKLQEALLRAGGWRDSAHLLTGDPDSDPESEKNGILGKILDSLQPQMTKTTWQRCEAVKFVYVWVVLQVSQPFLSPHLPRLLPATLLLADHHRPEISVLGVGCLHHIVLNTPAAELRQWNTAEVVYEALFKHLYATDAAVIQPVLQCLLDLLLVVEKPPCTLRPSASPRKPCRHDDVLRLMLTNMEAEHKVALRRAYASALPAVGVAICRHLRRLERVLLGYLEVPDPPEERSRLDVLQALQTTIRAAWPRMARPRGRDAAELVEVPAGRVLRL
ncbi:unnamed protein product [Tetraodon nigroviridis]|uniref:(spotted green pufferfish) hypothetical protein n=1 Tax=Tetraodon nigroviridis TaxID=99883 RepID=Q4SXM4_TETNG|nr:unnamed protein product [Tetraodon nigroviridis]